MKKIKYIVPFILIPFLFPLYYILDTLLLVEIFGCGCVDGFNANTLRMLVFALLAFLCIFLGFRFKFKSTKTKILYIVFTTILNIYYWYFIITHFAWK